MQNHRCVNQVNFLRNCEWKNVLGLPEKRDQSSGNKIVPIPRTKVVPCLKTATQLNVIWTERLFSFSLKQVKLVQATRCHALRKKSELNSKTVRFFPSRFFPTSHTFGPFRIYPLFTPHPYYSLWIPTYLNLCWENAVKEWKSKANLTWKMWNQLECTKFTFGCCVCAILPLVQSVVFRYFQQWFFQRRSGTEKSWLGHVWNANSCSSRLWQFSIPCFLIYFQSIHCYDKKRNNLSFLLNNKFIIYLVCICFFFRTSKPIYCCKNIMWVVSRFNCCTKKRIGS